MSKKTAELSAGLVAVKGTAAPPVDMPVRTAPAEAVIAPLVVPAATASKRTGNGQEGQEANLAPLNFRVTPTFRREFKTYAATHDLKLNELLRLSFDSYRRQNGN